MKTLIFLNRSALLVALCCLTEASAAMVDRSFRPGTGIAGGDEEGAHVVVPLGNGKIMVGGDFGTYNGIPRPDLVRLNKDGSLDESIHLPGGVNGDEEPTISSLGFQPDGKIIVSGHFEIISGVAQRYLARLHPDGTLDTAWVPALQARRSIVLRDGRILAWNPGLARLNVDGSLDTNFNPALDGLAVRTVSLQADGRILVTATIFVENRPVGQKLVRLHADGSVDTSFDPPQFPGTLGLNGAKEMPDRRILVFGEFGSVDGRARSGLALLRSDGRLDTTARFEGTGGYGRAWPLSDGSIVAYGVRDVLYAKGDVTVFTEPPKGQRLRGHPWRVEFTVSPTGYVYDIAEDARGRLLMVGEFYALNGVHVPTGITRLVRRGHRLP